MDALPTAFFFGLLVALCLIMVALFAIVRFGRKLLGQGGEDLAATLLPIVFALILWPFIRWPSHHLWDPIMLASAFVLVLLSIGRLTIFIVRCVRFR
jgi:hypothetical protein